KLSFFDLQDLIRPHMLDGLPRTGRPIDLYAIDLAGAPQPEVQTRIGGRRVADGCGHRAHLIADDDAGADAVAIAPRANQPDDQPAVVRRALVLPQFGRRVERQHDDIETAVAVEIRDAA